MLSNLMLTVHLAARLEALAARLATLAAGLAALATHHVGCGVGVVFAGLAILACHNTVVLALGHFYT